MNMGSYCCYIFKVKLSLDENIVVFDYYARSIFLGSDTCWKNSLDWPNTVQI